MVLQASLSPVCVRLSEEEGEVVGVFKKKKDDGKKTIKIKEIDVNGPKNPSMWCAMHRCTKLACSTQHD